VLAPDRGVARLWKDVAPELALAFPDRAMAVESESRARAFAAPCWM